MELFKYKFLLSQLVSRDFKTKYKRSILGILWSLLNPLLVMVVQYMVFSGLFKWDINNYAIYLLSGSVMFNFITESTSQALISITGNAGLITKVYIPKYIFPVSKVLSSLINFFLAFFALIIIVIIQRITPNIYYFAMIYPIICMLLFSVGVSLILSSMMVYFRDTQFLYGIFLTLWTYLTPLFYPESIIPDNFMIIIKMNPMYHYIKYVRMVILDGVLPSLNTHIYCIAFSIISLTVGIFIFKKAQKNFILNI